MKDKMICVVGPTASGKTSLAVEIAKKYSGEVVSADSMQIYKGMHIASAAPDEAEKQGVMHHLIEFLSPDVTFTVSDYVKAAKEKISDITARGKLPVIAGGTGLYIDSLVNNIEFCESDTDLNLREKLNRQYDEIGGEAMLGLMESFDPDTAATLHPNNRRRIIRAFELFEGAGITKTKQNELSRLNESPYESIMIGINYRDREKLYERINLRVDKMLESGLLDEAKRFYSKKHTGGAVQAIGHKELFPYLEGEISLEEAAENLKRATRRYAKRQITWFGRNPDITFIYPDETPDVLAQAIKILERKI